jgi:hypothetical protein
MRRRGYRGRWRGALVGVTLTAALVPVGGTAFAANPQGQAQPLVLSTLTGTNGVGRMQTTGLDCADGGSGSYRHMDFASPLAPGVLSQIGGNIRGTLDVHHDGQEPPVGPVVGGSYLQGAQSHVTMSNYRGAVQLLLNGSACTTTTPASPTYGLAFSPDGHTITAGPISGTFNISADPGATNGAYRSATGGGTFTLSAGIAPGADNGWSLALNGNIKILEPAMTATLTNTYWGNLGIDYATRIVSVAYQITNSGTGDAFNTSLISATSPTPGVTPLGVQEIPPGPQSEPLGDLLAGQSTTVIVAYQLGLLAPCALVILNCKFTSVLNVSMPDALDVPGTFTSTFPVTAPNLPPPLS